LSLIICFGASRPAVLARKRGKKGCCVGRTRSERSNYIASWPTAESTLILLRPQINNCAIIYVQDANIIPALPCVRACGRVGGLRGWAVLLFTVNERTVPEWKKPQPAWATKAESFEAELKSQSNVCGRSGNYKRLSGALHHAPSAGTLMICSPGLSWTTKRETCPAV
jgi:hypothetical protein